MSKRIKKYLDVMLTIPRLPMAMRRIIMRGLEKDKEFVKCICEICDNVIKSNVPMKLCQKRRLSRHKKTIRKLAVQGRKTIFKQKQKLIQQGNGVFLPLLFSIVAPMLANLIGRST